MNKDLAKFLVFWFIPVLLLFFWHFRSIIFPFLVGIIIGIAIQTFASYLTFKLKLNFYFNVFLVYALVIIVVGFVFYLVTQVLIGEFPRLMDKLKDYQDIFKSFNYKNSKFSLLKDFDIYSISSAYLSNAFGLVFSFLGGVFSLVLIFIVSIYVALRRNFPEEIFLFFSEEKRDDYAKIWRRIKRKISFWLIGQLFLGVFIGLSTYIFMGPIMKIDYAPMISLFSGLFELVPIIGPVLSLILALSITILVKPELFFFVLAFFILLQQLENHILVPLVMKKAIALHPLLVIFGILVGGKLGGVLGIIVILPILAASVEVINFLKMRGGVIGSTFPSGGKDSGSNPDPAADS